MNDMVLITKEQSNFIKGISIILMLLHHLFAYSERYPINAEIYFLSNSIRYEQFLGEIGKYCVPIFLFISGYGFAKSSNRDTHISYYLNKVLYIFIGYWLVFLIFVPLSYYFSEWKFVSLEPRSIISNFLGISNSYNGEWWFFLPYILLILLTPLFHRFVGILSSLLGLSLV
ncbi:acyltransferase family protein, partial [Ursidibacter sp. B-7004-1]